MMKYQLPNGNIILAGAEFIAENYPGATIVIEPEPEPAPPAPEQRHISVGAFFDRFGAAKWGILADTTATVQAVIKDASVRKYIDLDNPELSGGIALLVAAGHDVDATSIINAPVQAHELP